MPIMSALGAFSSRGFGQFVGTHQIIPPPLGTIAIIMPGQGSAITNKYTFADSTVVAGAALKVTLGNGPVGASNSQEAIGVRNPNTGPGNFQRYVFAGDQTLIGPLTTPSGTYTTNGGTSNAATALLLSDNSTNTCLYTYAAETTEPTTANGAAMTSSRYVFNVGNSTVAISRVGTSASLTTKKYAYAIDAWANGANLKSNSVGGAAGGIGEYAVIACGNLAKQVNQYVYATDTAAVLSSTLVAMSNSNCTPGFSNDTKLLINDGIATTSTEEYTYAASTWATGPTLTRVPGGSSGGTNGITGVTM